MTHDQTASIVFGVDNTRTGLPCRGGCGLTFHPQSSGSVADLEDAVMKRDAHELHLHGYRHVAAPQPVWNFTKARR